MWWQDITPSVLTHGWAALATAYAVGQAPMLVTLLRRRARLGKVLIAPVLGVPVILASGLAMAAVSPFLQGLGLESGSVLQFAAGSGLTLALGYGAARSLTRAPEPLSLHRRGAVVDEAGSGMPEALRGRQRLHAGRATSGLDQPLTLAGLAVSPGDETKHFKLIGTTGTGKSSAIRELLGGALHRGDRAIIADPDGGYLARFRDCRRGDLVLNPFEPQSLKWDLFGEIDHACDVEHLARSLLADQGGADRSWIGYARTFFTAVTRQARTAGITDTEELYRLLVSADTRELRALVAGTPAQPFLEEQNARMFDSIRSVTSSALGSLEYVSQQKAEPVSIRAWVRADERPQRRGVLFIPYRAGEIAALRSLIAAWMRLAIFEAMSRPEGDQRLWFVIDELDALGQIDGLKDALARLRKFGGRCVLGFQSIAQVSDTYGSGEARTIVENCGNTLILRCSGSDRGGTASFASQLIGQREVLRTSRSRSRRPGELLPSTTLADHVAIEPAVMDSQIEQLPDLCGYLKFASQPCWRRVALPLPDGPDATRARADARRLWDRRRFDSRANGSVQPRGSRAQERERDCVDPHAIDGIDCE